MAAGRPVFGVFAIASRFPFGNRIMLTPSTYVGLPGKALVLLWFMLRPTLSN